MGNARKERVESKRGEKRELKEHGVKRVECWKRRDWEE